MARVRDLGVRRFFATIEADASLLAGRALLALGAPADARPLLAAALALRVESDDPASPWLAETRVALANCALAGSDEANARELAAVALERPRDQMDFA
jgi:hypothetical protein